MGLEILIPLGAFAMFSWMLFVVVDSFRRRQQLRVIGEFHSKLLERLGSAGEFVEFLGTEGGTRFLASLNTERAPGGAHVRILRATQAGIVLLALGLGLFALMAVHANDYPRDTTQAVLMFGTIVFSLGIGLLASAAASYRLSKRMGLLPPAGADENRTPPLA